MSYGRSSPSGVRSLKTTCCRGTPYPRASRISEVPGTPGGSMASGIAAASRSWRHSTKGSWRWCRRSSACGERRRSRRPPDQAQQALRRLEPHCRPAEPSTNVVTDSLARADASTTINGGSSEMSSTSLLDPTSPPRRLSMRASTSSSVGFSARRFSSAASTGTVRPASPAGGAREAATRRPIPTRCAWPARRSRCRPAARARRLEWQRHR